MSIRVHGYIDSKQSRRDYTVLFFFTPATKSAGALQLRGCIADLRQSWNVKSQFQPGFQAPEIGDFLDEGFCFRSLCRCDTAVMSEWLLGWSLGMTLLPVCEQWGSCLLLAANLDPKLPDANNKCSFNVSLVTEVCFFFFLYWFSKLLPKFFPGWGKAELSILVWIKPTEHCNLKCKLGQDAVKWVCRGAVCFNFTFCVIPRFWTLKLIGSFVHQHLEIIWRGCMPLALSELLPKKHLLELVRKGFLFSWTVSI